VPDDQIKRNVIKGSISSMGIVNGMISMDYERNLLYVNLFKLNLEGTYGKYYQIYTKEAFQSLPSFHSLTSSINSLIGKNSHFFEIGLGFRYSFINDYYESIKPSFPVLNIGYRYQNPYGKGLVFRTFLGTTGLGISIGKAF
jgi:hypothetical protein